MSNHRKKPEEVLDDCLSRLQAQGATLEQLVEEGSAYAETVGPLLKIANLVHSELHPSGPSESFLHDAEIRLLNQVRARMKAPSHKRVKSSHPRRPLRLRLAPLLASLLLGAMLLLGSIGVIRVSAATLPGDGLYPLKTGLEEIRLALTFDAQAQAQLLGEFSDERIHEIEALLDAGRTQDLGVAIQAYLATLERFSEATDQITSDAAYDESQNAQDKIAHHIEVLQSLQAGLPAPAQAAIQRAIDRSREKNQDMEAHFEQRNQRQAEQISRKYDVPLEEVLEIYAGICAHKWNCVREYYREGGYETPTAFP